MSRHLLLRLFVVAAGLSTASAFGQAVGQPPPTLTYNPSTNEWDFQWLALAGQTYFVQSSEDMVDWVYYPVIEPGTGASILQSFGPTDGPFFRLRASDIPTTDADTADFDGDGLSNYDELNVYFTDPFNPDTDGDGMSDGWEAHHGLDPKDDGTLDPVRGPAGDPDGDGVSNLDEFRNGSDPYNSDSDGDGLLDSNEHVQGTDAGVKDHPAVKLTVIASES